MKSLEKLANEDQYKEEVVSGNLSNWILTRTFQRCFTARFLFKNLSEYKKASRARGDKLDTHPFYAFPVRDMPVFDVLENLLSSLPMVRCPQCRMIVVLTRFWGILRDHCHYHSFQILHSISCHLTAIVHHIKLVPGSRPSRKWIL